MLRITKLKTNFKTTQGINQEALILFPKHVFSKNFTPSAESLHSRERSFK